MATVAQVAKASLQRILVQGSEAAFEPDEYQDYIFALNNYMLALDAEGISLGFTQVSDLGDEVTVPVGALRGIIANMAIEVAPDYNGQITPGLQRAAKEGKAAMRKLGQFITPSRFPCTLPIGSGNEGSWAQWDSHFYGGECEEDILAETTGAIALETGTLTASNANTPDPTPVPGAAFIFKVTTTGDDEYLVLPLPEKNDWSSDTIYNSYDFVVDWGDGNSSVVTAFDDATISHFYPTEGEYTVSITGTCEGWRSIGDFADQITDIVQWGDVGFKDIEGGFVSCVNMEISATDAPNLDQVTSLDGTFWACEFVDGGIKNWQLPDGISLQSMFRLMPNYNEDLSGLDMSGVANLSYTFWGTGAFNNDSFAGKDLSSLVTAQECFSGSVFNGNVSGMDISNATNVANMFKSTPFNQNISTLVFADDCDLSGFLRDSEFNNDSVASITLGARCSMPFFLYENTVFNQDISGLDISEVDSLTGFLSGATAFSTTNYDSLLIAWAAGDVVAGLTFDCEATYNAGTSGAARTILTDAPNNWTINDGGAA